MVNPGSTFLCVCLDKEHLVQYKAQRWMMLAKVTASAVKSVVLVCSYQLSEILQYMTDGHQSVATKS